MKSNSLLLATLLLGIGLGIGYSLGRWQGNATGETARVSTGQQQQTSGKPTASSNNSAQPTTANAHSVTAKRLFYAVLTKDQGVTEDPVGRIRFQQALAQCDAVAISDLIEETSRFIYRNEGRVGTEAEEWGHIIIQRLAALDTMKAIEVFKRFKSSSLIKGTTELELIFATLSQQDPAQIPAALAKMEECGIKSEGERAWMLCQAKTDPESVFQYLMNPEVRKASNFENIKPLFMRLADYAPQRAITTLRDYGDKAQQRNLIWKVIDDWCRRSLGDAANYAMEQKDTAILSVIIQGGLSGCEATLCQQFTELKYHDMETRKRLAAGLADNLAKKDVAAARQWAATLPPTDQATANAAIAENWIEDDPVAASEWVATWPAGKEKESAAIALIDKIQLEDPERAITWATNCVHGRERYACLSSIMETFARQDPNAAAAARAALSEEDRALLDFTKKNPPIIIRVPAP